MILYNITIVIENGVQNEWLDWMRMQFIQPSMSTKLFESSQLMKVIDSPNEGTTYCLQFLAPNPGNIQLYKEQYEPEMMRSMHSRFANRFVSFSSLMEFVN